MICTLCETHELPYGSLCPRCITATRDRLQRLPRMWASLDAWLIPGRTGSAQYGGRVRRAEAPLPVDSEVLDLCAAGGIVGVLEDWREAVYEARGWTLPPRAASLAHRVAIAAADLAEQLDWISRWYAGEAFGWDIRRLVDRVRHVVRPGQDPDEPTFLGYCIAVDRAGAVCGARLYADMGKAVQCEWCLCQYPPDSWLALRHFQAERRQPRTADDEEHHLEPVAA
ncbi:hypothetical protein [Streptomyces sp. NBC_00557]|uniref:hypothetical protein n=1 Tax=Streptomyces sp. NBC_00557 TaxID=2975776 RepID=UPI002E82201D|nr:hypothetical protein [Streptomyces sp. NBC_00557]WUC36368.1 hypothetical protein OG956_20165 [Streptomyces sp. NBC_00557]